MIAFFDGFHNMLPGIGLTVRSTVVTTSQGVVVIAPFAFTDQQRAEISAMGEVVALVHPNLHHSVYAARAKAWWPRAALWGVTGLAEKKPDISWAHLLGRDPWPYESELQAIVLRGAPKLSETVFFHRATRTLIVTDLVLNLQRRTGLLTPLLFRLTGVYKRFAVLKFIPKMVEDRSAFSDCLRQMLSLDFDRLVMAHGEIISSGARPKLEALLDSHNLL